jgi:hypothetical protein
MQDRETNDLGLESVSGVQCLTSPSVTCRSDSISGDTVSFRSLTFAIEKMIEFQQLLLASHKFRKASSDFQPLKIGH